MPKITDKNEIGSGLHIHLESPKIEAIFRFYVLQSL